MCEMMMGGTAMGLGMAAVFLLVIGVVVLVGAAAIKYLFFDRSR